MTNDAAKRPETNDAAKRPIWTVRALLTWTTQFLHEKGVEAPRLEAQILLAHVLKCPKIELIVRSDDEPTADEKAAFRELVRKRADHWPTAYLVGKREFYLLPFAVSPAVLIPRPETESLVLWGLDRLKGLAAAEVLDLGTGSGCVAVSVAHQAKTARVTAVDLSRDALAVAAANAAAAGVADRVNFLQGDLFAPLPAGAAFDLILSNPPYISQAELGTLMPEVRDHEPRLALDGGPDGLNFYRRIAAGAAGVLKPGGAVAVEIGSTQAEAVAGLFTAAGFAVGPVLKDGNRLPRIVTATRG